MLTTPTIPTPPKLRDTHPLTRLQAITAVLNGIPVASTEPDWKQPAWAKDAIQLANAIARGETASTIDGLWNVMIIHGATALYIARIQHHLRDSQDPR